jgi:hypothetical protein
VGNHDFMSGACELNMKIMEEFNRPHLVGYKVNKTDFEIQIDKAQNNMI